MSTNRQPDSKPTVRENGIFRGAHKYIGDALMAVFGAPLVGQRDADNAVAAAIEMVRTLKRFNENRRAHGDEPLDISVGISTGEVIAGSIGSTKRMDYTVIGDSVNLAARLEGANKFFGTSILVSGETLAQMKSALAWREIDLIRVTSTAKLVSVFEPLEYYPHAVGAALKRSRGAYQRGGGGAQPLPQARLGGGPALFRTGPDALPGRSADQAVCRPLPLLRRLPTRRRLGRSLDPAPEILDRNEPRAKRLKEHAPGRRITRSPRWRRA